MKICVINALKMKIFDIFYKIIYFKISAWNP